MDQPLPLPVAAAAEIPPRSRDLCRRCRAPDVAVRRARRQQRRAGCRQPRVEARHGVARIGARAAARQLRERAHRGRGREPAQHHALDRFHRAEERPSAAPFATACWRWQRGSRSRAGWSIPGGCRWPPAIRLAIQRAGRLCRWRMPGGAARRCCARRAARQRLAARSPGWRASRSFSSAATGAIPDAFRSVQADLAKRDRLAKVRHCFTGNSLCPLRCRARSRRFTCSAPTSTLPRAGGSYRPGAIQAAVDRAECKF